MRPKWLPSLEEIIFLSRVMPLRWAHTRVKLRIEDGFCYPVNWKNGNGIVNIGQKWYFQP